VQAKPITIVGGGLAGLTLGIGLRRLNVPVRLWEAGQYPRHRVCGEFVNGRGLQVLERLGLFELFRDAGAVFSRTARLFMRDAASPARLLEPPALCLSRFTMDELLARQFSVLGGELRQNSRWSEESDREGVVVASGRIAKSVQGGWRWFGVKVHARGVPLETDLEMHATANGYVGLCHLPGDEVNVCGLFRTGPKIPAASPIKLLTGNAGSELERRLANARFDERSFCSIAGLSLQPRSAAAQRGCRLGDALSMIPPVTGNGMSMAFEAAAIALGPLESYARGNSDWQTTQKTIARECDAAFRQRLFWARWLHLFMFHPVSRGRLGALVLNCDWAWHQVFSRTR
jgi:menaquinone-9 beta-reductase